MVTLYIDLKCCIYHLTNSKSQQSKDDLIRIEFEASFNIRVKAMSRGRKERMIMNGIDRLVDGALAKLDLHSASKSFSNY